MAVFLNVLNRWESAELNQEGAAELLGVSARIKQFAKSPASFSIGEILVASKIAFAGGFPDLVVSALHEAGKASEELNDRDQRASELASVAALSHELLSQ
jgi:hypothetical protein